MRHSFQPWCSTEVDDNGHHKGGRGKWGNCGPGCPIPPDDRESTVVVPDTKGRIVFQSNSRQCFYWQSHTRTMIEICDTMTGLLGNLKLDWLYLALQTVFPFYCYCFGANLSRDMKTIVRITSNLIKLLNVTSINSLSPLLIVLFLLILICTWHGCLEKAD